MLAHSILEVDQWSSRIVLITAKIKEVSSLMINHINKITDDSPSGL